jgi:putative ABC transport system permease protein
MKRIKYQIRNFKRSPLLLFVSVPSLAIGLAGFLLLMIYLKHETSYDQHFKTKERVFRLYNTLTERGSSDTWPICLRDIYTEIKEGVPEVEAVTQIYRGWGNNVKYEEKKLSNIELMYVDNGFFKVFGLELSDGNAKDALLQKNTVILTQTLAKKIFENQNPIGKVIKIMDEDFTVNGIIPDFPKTTHFQTEMLASISTIRPERFGGLEFFTYYLLSEGADSKVIGDKIADLNTKILKAKWNDSPSLEIASGVENLADIHLHTLSDWDLSPKGNLTNLYVVGFLAFLILLIAVVNHINLYMLHGEKRFLEIGIRKSLGASISNLKSIFYTEIAFISTIAFAIAVLLTYAILPDFAHLMNLDLLFEEIQNLPNILLIFAFLLLLIFTTGLYPSFYLSKLQVIKAISGNTRIERKKWLSVISVLIQFSISIFLITGLIIMNRQVHYLKNIPLGFEVNNIIKIGGFNNKISSNWKAITAELEKLPFVVKTAASDHSMGSGCSGQRIYKYGESAQDAPGINEYRIQAGFCDLMKMELIEGRFFEPYKKDRNNIILNEAAVKMLNISDPVGKKLVMHDDPMEIVGVVKDFYYYYSGAPIAAMALTYYSDRVNSIYLKITGDFNLTKRDKVKEIMLKFDPDYKLATRELSDIYKKKFVTEDRLMKLLLYGTILALIISFAGMFALSVFNVEKRTKEIGIRKVLGSTSVEILTRLLMDTIKWVLWSMPVSFLLSFLIMRNWLQEFPNKIDISIIYFFTAGVMALVIAILAVSIKSFQAARRNPVDSLRYE